MLWRHKQRSHTAAICGMQQIFTKIRKHHELLPVTSAQFAEWCF